MASRGVCFRIERGYTDVYHLNEVIDNLKEYDIIDDKSPAHFGFNFDLVENPFGKFLLIQRLRESRTASHTIRAGVIIPYYLIDELIDKLNKIKEFNIDEKSNNLK